MKPKNIFSDKEGDGEWESVKDPWWLWPYYIIMISIISFWAGYWFSKIFFN